MDTGDADSKIIYRHQLIWQWCHMCAFRLVTDKVSFNSISTKFFSSNIYTELKGNCKKTEIETLKGDKVKPSQKKNKKGTNLKNLLPMARI